MSELISNYDAALFDLDGVVYLGSSAVPAAPGTMTELAQRSIRCGYVTNNAARTPATVAAQLCALGIPATADDVITSAQAVGRMLQQRYPAQTSVFVLGAPALADEVLAAQMHVASSADDQPRVVVQGLDPKMTWDQLCEAAVAIQRGADWIAANLDPTRPTERGLLPGCGAGVAALQLAVEIEPEVAGKPFPPLMEQTVERMGSAQPIFAGDRLDTDIAGANRIGIDSLLVLSGAHGLTELFAAAQPERPTHLGLDVSALVQPARQLQLSANHARCGTQQISVESGELIMTSTPDTSHEVLDAAWAAVNLHWHRRARRASSRADAVLARLVELLTAQKDQS